MKMPMNLKNHVLRNRSFIRRSKRSSHGMSLAEVACSSFMVIFMLILTIDAWMLISAFQMNDVACRDATRAASQAPDYQTATIAAAAAVAAHRTGASMFTSPISTSQFNYVDYTGGATIPPGGTPYVSVTTTCQVKPIIPLSIVGTIIIGNASITLNQTYTFPLVRSKASPT